MLKIGEFSLAGRVSVRTLRLYDELGLLPPARIDPESGYRRYSVRQLPRLHRILALKELGLSLDEIGLVLAGDGPPPAEFRAMLEGRRDEARRAVAEGQDRLARIEARLRQLDQLDRKENDPMDGYEIVLKSVPAQRVAAIRETLPAYQAVGTRFQEIAAFLGAQRIRPGAFVAVWHRPEFQEQDIDGEAAVVVDGEGPLPANPRVREGELPGTERMACLVHQGAFADLPRAYGAMTAWLEANGERIAGPTREVYHRGGPDQHDPSYVTEVQFPVTRA